MTATVALPIEVRVYGATGAGTFAVLPKRWNVRFLDELNGIGSGSFSVSMDDPALTSRPGLLDYGAVVKFAVPDANGTYREIVAWVIERAELVLVAAGESSPTRTLAVSGRGVKALLENGEVLPFDGWRPGSGPTGTAQPSTEYTPSGRPRHLGPATRPHRVPLTDAALHSAVRPSDLDTRYVGWMSATTAWIRSADWVAPLGAARNSPGWNKYIHKIETVVTETETVVTETTILYPIGFADTKALWIWPPPQGPRRNSPPCRSLFRANLDLAKATAVEVVATADNEMRLFLDEQMILSHNDWYSCVTTTISLPAGRHVIAVEGTNWGPPPSGNNPGGVLVSVADAHTHKVLLRSDTTHWKCTRIILPGTAKVPGASAAAVLIELLAEAGDRGVRGIASMHRDFSETVDSNGFRWVDTVEQSFAIGTDLLNVADQLTETTFDVRVGTDLTVHAYLHQGDNFAAGTSPVRFAEGVNLLSCTWTTGGSKPRTNVVAHDQVGWSSTSSRVGVATFGRIEGHVDVGNSAAAVQTRRIVAATLPGLARLEQVATVTIRAISGAVPFADFDIGDTVLSLDPGGAMAPMQVLSIAGEMNEAGTDTAWTVELMQARTTHEGGALFSCVDGLTLDLAVSRLPTLDFSAGLVLQVVAP